MISEGIGAFRGRRVLMLQGPMGPFFLRLAHDLREAGASVWKINFNGGDLLFYPRSSRCYRGTLEQWPAFFEDFVRRHGIDVVLLFGDCRPLHAAIRQTAQALGVELGVFEEGYVRPDFITLERFGVNGHSLIVKDPQHYREDKLRSSSSPMQVGNTFWYGVLWTMLYFIASAVLRPCFRNYRHHRPLTLLEAWPWTVSCWRKLRYAWSECHTMSTLAAPGAPPYFLVPLQVHNDAQIKVHSEFASVDKFIVEVLYSFAVHAPPDSRLVIKHHPMDRGYHDYSRLIRDTADAYGVSQRVLYIHDQHLPTLLQQARGVVLVNSTVGLSALHHGKPLKVCGSAIYDLPGLTFQGELEEFWSVSEEWVPDARLYKRYRQHLIQSTQLNGNFFKRLPIPGSHAGLRWTIGPALKRRPPGRR